MIYNTLLQRNVDPLHNETLLLPCCVNKLAYTLRKPQILGLSQVVDFWATVMTPSG